MEVHLIVFLGQRALDPSQALGFFSTYFCRMTSFLPFILVIRLPEEDLHVDSWTNKR